MDTMKTNFVDKMHWLRCGIHDFLYADCVSFSIIFVVAKIDKKEKIG